MASMLLLLCSFPEASTEEATAISGPVAVQTLAPLVKRVARTEVTVKAVLQTIEAYPVTSPGPGAGFPDGPLPVTQDVYGAGVIVDADRGLIVTSDDLVKGTETISVLLSDGRSFPARVSVRDDEFGLAILRVDASGLIGSEIDSLNRAEPGDFVLAMGDPLELEHSVTFGMISAVHRSRPGIPGRDLIQTDILLGRGSSGGPLFNLRGEIVGINIARTTATPSERGFGFAAPASAVLAILNKAQQAD